MRRLGAGVLAALFVGMLLPGAAGAAAVKIWLADTASDFSAGEARGVSVSADGTLFASQRLERVEGISEAVLFAAAPGRNGELFVATGDSGRVLRVGRDGKVETLATLPEQEVTAILVGPDGAVYAGTSPGGKVYRLEGASPLLYYDTQAQYVWALAFAGPVLYVATGVPGEIHRATSPGKGERVHATTDSHVRTLFADREGRIWAGTSGSGLVLRIEKTGRVATLYDSGKPEVTSIAPGRDGRVWAAFGAADPSGGGSEPISVPPPTASAASKAAKAGGPRDDDGDKDKPEVTVTVSAPRLAPPRSSSRSGYSAEVVLFEEGEPPRPVWTSSDEVVFDLAPDGDGPGVLAATGPKGKLYAIGADTSSLLRTFDEKQVTFLAGEDVGTNGSTALYRRVNGALAGEYVSAVKDTGRTSRFGAFRWEGALPRGSKLEYAFRSGESATPDGTWSGWSDWIDGDHRTLPVAAPDGRYLQWRLRMTASDGQTPRVRRTEAAYRNRNAAPVVESLIALEPAEVFARSGSGGSNVFETVAPDEKGIFTSLEEPKSESAPRKLYRKGYRTLTWKASDPDSDALAYDVEFRPLDGTGWLPLRKDVRDSFYSFDATSLPDGEYVFRLTASDADANPGDGKTTSRESAPTRVDNTPPRIRQVSATSGALELEVADVASPITEVEYSLDAKKWTRVEPTDGLSDSMREGYDLRLDPAERGGYLLVRATDAARNVGVASFAAP